MGPLVVRRRTLSLFFGISRARFLFCTLNHGRRWQVSPRLALLSLIILIISLLPGFFKGTSADQDRRFSDKELKLLKSIKFPPQFDTKVFPFTFSYISLSDKISLSQVDMRKVNLQVIRPWVAKKVVELVGFEDEVLIEYAMGLLEDQSKPVNNLPSISHQCLY